ncbi:hypothetical protein BG004_005128 [Podila humilis]|nr:hypothetical protein BG004_005128 [Podila humilis]
MPNEETCHFSGFSLLSPASRLAPEIILHILAFLDYSDRPARLLPIVTLNKTWSRLALILLYEQPVLTIPSCDLLVKTLQLKDQTDGKIFWDPSLPCDGASQTEFSLFIDYTRLVKKPCRIVGSVLPSRHDLFALWDLQNILWNSPNFKASDSGKTSPVYSPLPAPTSPLSGFSAVRPSSRPSSPSSGRAVMVRRRKKPASAGPVVMLLDIACVMSRTIESVLAEVSGLRLKQLQIQFLLDSPIAALVRNNISTLEVLTITRSSMHPNIFLDLAQAIGDSSGKQQGTGIKMLKIEDCQRISQSILSAFAQPCAETLRSLDIRSAHIFRAVGDHVTFPMDGPGNWDPEGPEDVVEGPHDIPRFEPGERCFRCGTIGVDACLDQDNSVGNHTVPPIIQEVTLSAAQNPPPDQASPDTPQNIIAADQHPDTRLDLALAEFAETCNQLQYLCLHRMTWLSDEALAGFRPSSQLGEKSGLRSIEIMDSHYGSTVTIEGLLEICGTKLESLTVDRRSCWRIRPRPHGDRMQSTLCADCYVREVKSRAIERRRATGDRILVGLLQKEMTGTPLPRLRKVALLEHWVTVQVLKKVMMLWHRHLRELDLKIYRCPIEVIRDSALSYSNHEGKVHGSLARAGKVKSQTPKVAKQEKKKKLTGRAKKRDTYKRRFVNVTNAPGGKRRMNVNPESTKN